MPFFPLSASHSVVRSSDSEMLIHSVLSPGSAAARPELSAPQSAATSPELASRRRWS